MPKQIFERMIIGSNEKSIITNNAGFGVRTISAGLSQDLALKIFQEVKTIYELPVSRQVTSRQLREDASIVCKYPRTYRLGQYVSEGKKYYIASCATYVGVDYGYFCGKENARRAGTNYLSDVFISELPISPAIWALAAKNQLFAPKDNTASPDNVELRTWLTGEPNMLPQAEVELPSFTDTAQSLTETQRSLYPALLIALLQTKINRDCKKDDPLCRLMVLAPDAKTNDFLSALAVVPIEIVADLSLETNYINGHGMPESCNLVTINEYNTEETYAGSYVVLDLNNAAPKLQNVSNNAIFEEITSLVNKGNMTNAASLASYLYAMTVHPTTDYEALRKAFLLIESNLPFDYKIIDTAFLQTMSKANLSTEKQQKLKKVISDKFNEEIQNSDQLESVLARVENVWSSFKAFFTISEQNRQKLTDLWLGGKLVDHVAQYGEAFVTNCLQKTFSSKSMLNVLQLSGSIPVWKHFLNLTFGDSLPDQFDNVVKAVLKSKLTVQDQQQLIGETYPISASTKDNFIRLFKDISGTIAKFEELFTRLCLSYKDAMVDFARASKSLDIMGRVIDKYILGNVSSIDSSSLPSCISRLREMHGELGGERLKSLRIKAPDKIRGVIFSAPEKVQSQDIQALEELPYFLADREDFIVIRTIKDNDSVPDEWTTVTTENIELAIKMKKSDDFIDSMFSLWLTNDEGKKDLRKFVEEANIKGFERQSRMLLATWSQRINRSSLVTEYTKTLITSFKWGDSDKIKFLKQCSDKELSTLVEERLSWWRKLLLKLFESKNKSEAPQKGTSSSIKK